MPTLPPPDFPLLVESAVKYVSRGWKVMPIPWGRKFPPVKHWSADGKLSPVLLSLTPGKAKRWWEGIFRGYNIALCCGAWSGVFVLDLDGPGAEHEITGLPIPQGPQVLTSRGRHFYFRYPVGREVNPSVGIRPHVDVRGRGSYCLVPPSLHPSGFFYRWAAGTELLELPDAPSWLFSWFDADRPTRSAPIASSTPRTFPVDPRFETFPQGSRNQGLFRIGSRLRRSGLSADEIFQELCGINALRCIPPLEISEISTIAHSAAKYPPGRRV